MMSGRSPKLRPGRFIVSGLLLIEVLAPLSAKNCDALDSVLGAVIE